MSTRMTENGRTVPQLLDSLFKEAVSAMDAGDIDALELLLSRHPALVRERLESPGAWLRDRIGGALDGFFKSPWLLWFVAEDPVRNDHLPGNVAQVAGAIIRSARREAPDSVQEQIDYALYLAVCSPIGRDDGLQLKLLDALLDAGARTEGRGLVVQALICRNERAAEHLVSRGAGLDLAAALCLGRWDEINNLAAAASAHDRQVALSLAALNGKARAIELLLGLGVDVNAYAVSFYTHATPLHHAVDSGSLEAVKVLVEAGARLDTKDTAWNGTPLGWAEHEGRAEIAGYLRAKEASGQG